MSRCFVFCHGFGFDKNFWRNLSPYFSKEYCIYLDLGYFSNGIEFVPPGSSVELIAIGHSLGFAKLLSWKFDYLIGIQAFANFLGNNQEINNKRTNELMLMAKNLDKNPIVTLRKFYQKVGINYFDKNIILDKDKLLADITFLSKNYILPTDVPTLIMATEHDPIVPKDIILDNFISNVKIEFIDGAHHALGYYDAEHVYKTIMAFCNR